jgi:hypothetical protein
VLDIDLLYSQAARLLYLERIENYRNDLPQLLKHVYHLPERSHLAAMTKQFMLDEQLTSVIHELFHVLKKIFEDSIKKFVHARNRYIHAKNLDAPKNNIDEIISGWEQANIDYGLNSSSSILFFAPAPKFITVAEREIELTQDPSIPILQISAGDEGKKLEEKIRKFSYKGFCPKKARRRLLDLLKFPIEELAEQTKRFDPTSDILDFKELEETIGKHLQGKGKIWPEITETFPREQEPKDLDDLKLTKWFVQKIMELRKKLIPYGQQIENRYVDLAEALNKVVEILK